MSFTECDENPRTEAPCPLGVDAVVLPRTGDIGGFTVQRALPSKTRRMVGPFVFWDQMGPGDFDPGVGLDVRPHPHIGLATITFLFDGTMAHKDSLGNDTVITPGEVNLMTAGRGIVHSERSDPASRADRSRLFGIQSWIALPEADQETDPAFAHYDAAEIPVMEGEGVSATVIMGRAFGKVSPVRSHADVNYVELHLAAGARTDVPIDIEERALYIVGGNLVIDGHTFEAGQLVVLKPGTAMTIEAQKASHVMLLGGARMDGPRYLWWNFVSTSKERIREAAVDWQNGRFPLVPGDDQEFIPLPDIKGLDAVRA